MNPVHEQIAEVGHKATIAGSAGSLAAWITSSEFGMWAGIVIGLAGLIVNWYFRRKSDRRAIEIHNAFLEKLNRGEIYPPDPQKIEKLEGGE